MTTAAGSSRGASDAALVTVITATYNSSAVLSLALQSLLLQDFGNFEAWVVGDACTDDSAEVVGAFGDARLHWLNLPRNSGSQAGPNNEGLRHARGDFVAYLGHDDLWLPWHLSGLVSFARDQRADLVHSLSAVLTPGGLEWVGGPPPRGRTYADHFVFPSSWLHRRRLHLECGEWNDPDALSRAVDMDYLARVHAAGKAIACLEQLSVLKFPSPRWRMYSLASGPPQLPYLQAMRADAHQLHGRLLSEIAAAFARSRADRPTPGFLLRQLLRSCVRALLDLYGRDRWPSSRFRHWYFQRIRRQLRTRRGLAPRQGPR